MENENKSESKNRKSKIFKIIKIQILCCSLAYLTVLGFYSMNREACVSVMADIDDFTYKITNIDGLNDRLNTLASKNKLISFILGRLPQKEEEIPISTEDIPDTGIVKIDSLLVGSSLEDFSAAEVINNIDENKIEFTDPVKGNITSPFGYRKDPFTKKQSFHTGIDISAVTGTNIASASDGTVKEIGYSRVWGNYILVNHNKKYDTFYAHLSYIAVKEGVSVNKGDVIGKAGNTGRSTGSHLHFEIREFGERVDPQNYVDFK